MGLLIQGQWRDRWYETKDTGGRFVRKASGFRDWVRADGSTPYAPEAGRYHLYVSFACPWAHRTLIFRRIKGLTDVIGLSVVHPLMLGEGWTFGTDYPGATGDLVGQRPFYRDLYTAAVSDYSGRVTVPVLWDTVTNGIVSNESSEIIRMFDREFAAVADPAVPASDHYPGALREEIDFVNARVYDTLNNGVYRCGFATSQEAYEEAYVELFDTMDWLEERLATKRYLVGDTLTEADWRLFTTLVRFDAVYYSHFKCNRRRLIDYKNLWGFTRELYQRPGVAETVRMDHIKDHYFGSHESVNPTRIVPVGPALDFGAPHGRQAATK